MKTNKKNADDNDDVDAFHHNAAKAFSLSLSRSVFAFFIIYHRRSTAGGGDIIEIGLKLPGFIEFFLSFRWKKIVNKSPHDDYNFGALYTTLLRCETMRISRVVILRTTAEACEDLAAVLF